ncbi:DNA-directed RNA polymerase subunit beta' [bacterium HR35]|nr:DNA-directed RNA polymerase subunit beta' [bacterium HR35]
MSLIKKPTSEIEKLVLKIASPEEILSWSHGEVLKPETINYRTGKPDRYGLFSEVIFGPIKDYECACGKYKKPQVKGIVCERCDVEVTSSSVRKERMGHITLMSPVAHIWYLKVYPYPLKLFLDIPLRDLERVIYYSAYIITQVNETKKKEILEEIEKEYKEFLAKAESREEKRQKTEIYKQIKEELNSLQVKKVLSDSEYFYFSKKYPGVFEVDMGAEPIRRFLEEIDLEKLREETIKKLAKADPQEKKILSLKLKFINAFIKYNRRPEWMILTILPVVPPDIRPVVQLQGGKIASSDLNDLYRRIINRNNRLKRLLEMKSPEIILKNEKRMLQEAVDALIDISLKKEKIVIGQRKVLKSLGDFLKGKEGRFRQNLLGKRVDYSGRSVIVVDPTLRVNECGLPKKMALEIFKPFIIHELLKRGVVQTTKKANYLIERMDPEALSALEVVIKNRYILLNRPPTLHKLSFLAFQPILVEGLAIRIPPLVCSGFNADFDGDQMGCFLPLSSEAQREARELMNALYNVLRPGTGMIEARPDKDMIAGIYYLTLMVDGLKGEGKYFADENDAILAYENNLIDLQAKIKVKKVKNEEKIETTVGRIIFNRVLPSDFPFINEVINRKSIIPLLLEILDKYGIERLAIILDELKTLGFKYATHGGITLSISDLTVPSQIEEILNEALEEHKKILEAYNNGLLNKEEKNLKLQEVWVKAKVKAEEYIKKNVPLTNNARLLIDAGARGSYDQLIQMVAFKGVVRTPTNEPVHLPIASPYLKGLSPLEYFSSTHGARKGVADKALKTPHSGYLTRILASALHDVIVREIDCGTKEGIVITREEAQRRGVSFGDALFSRVALEDIKNSQGQILVRAGEFITYKLSRLIDKDSSIKEAKVRSVFTCKTLYGVCQKCYGLDLSTHQPVKLGEAVGLIATHSIGERLTQFVLRSFHAGGVISAKDITQDLPRVKQLFEVSTPKNEAVLSPVKGKISEIREFPRYWLIKIRTRKNKEVSIKIPSKFRLFVKKGQIVNKGDILNEGIIDPKAIYLTKGKMETFKYILNEVRSVYSNQGADIHEKYIELVIRKMFSRVKVIDPGDSEFVIGEIIEKDLFIEKNREIIKNGLKPAKAVLLLMGIKKVASTPYSFLSAASFQETSRALVRAALECREDRLIGINENVIIGKKPLIGEEFRKRYLEEENLI